MCIDIDINIGKDRKGGVRDLLVSYSYFVHINVHFGLRLHMGERGGKRERVNIKVVVDFGSGEMYM